MKAVVLMRAIVILFGFSMVAAIPAAAHCDTLDGPVVAAARRALSSGDVTPVLKWVQAEHEAEIRDAFAKTIKVRAQSADAREMADKYFFETLVRVHRAGENAPFTGLKAAGEVEPDIAAADSALENGTVEQLAAAVAKEVAEGIRQRFAKVQQARPHAEESVAAGREYVEAYVEFIHYIERLHQAMAAGEQHGGLRAAHMHPE